MKITYKQIKNLNPCWSNDELLRYLPKGIEVELTLNLLQSGDISDARWLVSRLLARPQLIMWAKTCAKRAKKYAAAWAADAADAAAWADAAADAAKENYIALKHALALLNGKGMK